MNRRNLLQGAIAIPLAGLLPPVWASQLDKDFAPVAFGFGGSRKMIYDIR